MSNHKATVIVPVLEPHPNADSLSIVRIGGFTVCTQTAAWGANQLAAYVQPDSLVPVDRPEFAFLADQTAYTARSTKAQPGDPATHHRVTVRKLRGVPSMGLLVPAPEGAKVGDDAAPALGVLWYDPPVNTDEAISGPIIHVPVYDVENLRHDLQALAGFGELVVTEKIHGANARYTCVDGEFYAGSKSQWKRGPNTIWHRAAAAVPGIEAMCRQHEGLVVYGEVYGPVQSLRYGKAEPTLAVFDIYRGGAWESWGDLLFTAIHYGLPLVPVVDGPGHFTVDQLLDLAEGPSLIEDANHIREGVVVRNIRENRLQDGTRALRKIVSNAYLASGK